MSLDERIAALAVTAGVCGVLAMIPLPSLLRAVSLLVFTLIGPGSAVMCWVDLPPAVTTAATVGVSIASLMAVAVAMAWVQFWYPVPICLLLAALVTASGLIRLRMSRNSMAELKIRSW